MNPYEDLLDELRHRSSFTEKKAGVMPILKGLTGKTMQSLGKNPGIIADIGGGLAGAGYTALSDDPDKNVFDYLVNSSTGAGLTSMGRRGAGWLANKVRPGTTKDIADAMGIDKLHRYGRAMDYKARKAMPAGSTSRTVYDWGTNVGKGIRDYGPISDKMGPGLAWGMGVPAAYSMGEGKGYMKGHVDHGTEVMKQIQSMNANQGGFSKFMQWLMSLFGGGSPDMASQYLSQINQKSPELAQRILKNLRDNSSSTTA